MRGHACDDDCVFEDDAVTLRLPLSRDYCSDKWMLVLPLKKLWRKRTTCRCLMWPCPTCKVDTARSPFAQTASAVPPLFHYPTHPNACAPNSLGLQHSCNSHCPGLLADRGCRAVLTVAGVDGRRRHHQWHQQRRFCKQAGCSFVICSRELPMFDARCREYALAERKLKLKPAASSNSKCKKCLCLLRWCRPMGYARI